MVCFVWNTGQGCQAGRQHTAWPYPHHREITRKDGQINNPLPIYSDLPALYFQCYTMRPPFLAEHCIHQSRDLLVLLLPYLQYLIWVWFMVVSQYICIEWIPQNQFHYFNPICLGTTRSSGCWDHSLFSLRIIWGNEAMVLHCYGQSTPPYLFFLQSILYHPIVSVFHLCIACLYILSLNFFCLFHLKLYLTYLGKYLAFRQSSIHFTEWINKRMIIWMRYSFSYRRPASKIDIGGREEWLFFPKENLRFCFAREKKKVLLGKYKITDIP